MTHRQDSPPATPYEAIPTQTCMTLRDYFAGQALAGFLSNGAQRTLNEAHKQAPDFLGMGPTERAAVLNEQLAIGCYQIADAMLAYRIVTP
jgi:hypothetical protein